MRNMTFNKLRLLYSLIFDSTVELFFIENKFKIILFNIFASSILKLLKNYSF